VTGQQRGFVWDQLPALLWALTIVAASSIPASSFPDSEIFRWDKAIHLCVYAILTLFVYRAFVLQNRYPFIARNAILLTLAAVIAFGFSDEAHQYFVPGRSSDIKDVAADAAGALVVAAIVYWLARRQRAAH
jgi:VanZ family protein